MKKKPQLMACALMTSKVELLCCGILVLALDVTHQCAGSMEPPSVAQENSKCLEFLGFCELFQNCSLSEAGQTTGMHSSVPWVALQAVIKCPLFLVPKIGFLLPCVLCTAWESSREVIALCWSLREP